VATQELRPAPWQLPAAGGGSGADPGGSARLSLLVGTAVLAFLAPHLPQPAAALGGSIALAVLVGAWVLTLGRRLAVDAVVAAGAGLTVALGLWVLTSWLLFQAGAGTHRWGPGLALACALAAAEVVRPRGAREPARPAPGAPGRSLPVATAAALGVLYAGGGVGVVLSMQVATHGASLSAAFALFWLGMLAMLAAVVTAAWLLDLNRPGAQLGVLVATVAALFVPQIAREPRHPLMYDELGHLGETLQLLTSGRLYRPDAVVAIGPKYPGLETATALASELTKVDPYHVGVAIIVLAHVSALLGVVLLARGLTRSPRAQVLAAGVYALNPSFLRIDAWFSYESLALPLGIWVLAASVQVGYSGRWRNPWWLVVATTGLALVITHHLTSYVFAVLGLLAGLATLAVPGRRRDAGPILATALALAATASVWVALRHAPLLHYLSPYPRDGWNGLLELLHLRHKPAPSVLTTASLATSARSPLGGSLLPGYETVLAFVAPVLVGALTAVVAWVSRRRLTAMTVFWLLVAVLYLASLPFTVSNGAAPGAHRSWAATYLGVGVLAAVAFEHRSTRERARGRDARPDAAGLVRLAALPSLLGVLLLGNYAAGCNGYVQLPGPFIMNTDGRSVSDDMIAAAQWFARTEGPGRRISTNIRTMAVFGSYGQALPYPESAAHLYPWDLFYPERALSEVLHAKALASGLEFVVVDRRLATLIPPKLPYFSPYEPIPASLPFASAAVTKFDQTTWLHAVYRGPNIVIYRVSAA
jgi:hypothetical protein